MYLQRHDLLYKARDRRWDVHLILDRAGRYLLVWMLRLQDYVQRIGLLKPSNDKITIFHERRLQEIIRCTTTHPPNPVSPRKFRFWPSISTYQTQSSLTQNSIYLKLSINQTLLPLLQQFLNPRNALINPSLITRCQPLHHHTLPIQRAQCNIKNQPPARFLKHLPRRPGEMKRQMRPTPPTKSPIRMLIPDIMSRPTTLQNLLFPFQKSEGFRLDVVFGRSLVLVGKFWEERECYPCLRHYEPAFDDGAWGATAGGTVVERDHGHVGCGFCGWVDFSGR